MSLDVNITDAATHQHACVKKPVDGDEYNLCVATTPQLQTFETREALVDPNLGANINVNFGVGGTPVIISTGEDIAAWTSDIITGTKFTIDSTDQAFSGTQSLEINNAATGDSVNYTGTPVDMNDYVSVSLKVYIDSDWGVTDSIGIQAWDTVSNTGLGSIALLENYVDIANFNTWQSANIPKGNLGINTLTVDTFKISIVARTGKGPTLYIDNWQIEESGILGNYVVAPPAGKSYLIKKLIFSLADTLDISVTNGTAPGLDYNKLLGVPALGVGINFRLETKGETVLSIAANNLGDFLQQGAEVKSILCDGTRTFLKFEYEFSDPVRLYSAFGDSVTINTADDLSPLDLFRVYAVILQAVEEE